MPLGHCVDADHDSAQLHRDDGDRIGELRARIDRGRLARLEAHGFCGRRNGRWDVRRCTVAIAAFVTPPSAVFGTEEPNDAGRDGDVVRAAWTDPPADLRAGPVDDAGL